MLLNKVCVIDLGDVDDVDDVDDDRDVDRGAVDAVVEDVVLWMGLLKQQVILNISIDRVIQRVVELLSQKVLSGLLSVNR